MGLLRKAVRKSMPKPVKKARRTVRKATHPVSTARRAVTPAPIRRATGTTYRVTHPIDTLENKALDAIWLPSNTGRKSPKPATSALGQPGGWPKRFTDAWFRDNVPLMSAAEVESLVSELARRNWTAPDLEARVYPYCTCC